MIQSITVDTGVWIELLDKKSPEKSAIDAELLEECQARRVQVWASSRVLNPDSTKMRELQRVNLTNLLEEHAQTAPSQFRFDISPFGGPDGFQGRVGERFISVVGESPDGRGQFGKKLHNHIGDYDALRDHFIQRRDLFVTWDNRGFLHTDRRQAYEEQLKLRVRSPEEAIETMRG